MGIFSRIKVIGRKNKHVHPDVEIDIEVHEPVGGEERDSSVVLWKPRTDPTAERDLPEFLWDAAHAPEVLSIRSSLLRDPTLDVLCRTFSNASSTAVASSAASTPALVLKTPRASKVLHLYDFKQILCLGSGGCAKVYLVKHIPTGKELAMKVIDKRSAQHDFVLKEQRVMKDVGTKDIKHFMEFYGSFHNPRHYFFLTKYYPGGDLGHMIHRWGGLMPAVLTKALAAECLSAVHHLHSLSYAHRDIKPENFLISETGHVILADFGYAKSFVKPGQMFALDSDERCELSKTLCGTPHYLSPEQCLEDPYDAFKSDVWALGITFFALFLAKLPWTADPDDTYEVIVKHLFASMDEWLDGEYLDEELRSLLEGMLDVDPFYRLTPKEAMTHPFWCDVNWEAIAKGEIPLPDVGNPPYSIPSGDSDVFFGSFSGGGVYLRSDDPLPEFNYVSPLLADGDHDDDDDFSDDDNYGHSATTDSVVLTPQDSFEDVLLDDFTSDTAVEPVVDSPVPPPLAAVSMSPPAMLVGMVGVMTTVTVTVEDDMPSGELEVEPESSVGIMVAMEVKRSGLFGHLKSWFTNVASSIVRLCSRVSVN